MITTNSETLHTSIGPKEHTNKWLFCILISMLFTWCVINIITKQFASFGPETDFLGFFIKEASRFTSGQPLILGYHPPLYSITLGITNTIFHNFFFSGLIISFVSSIIAVILIYHAFTYLWGSSSGLGAVIFTLCNPVFLTSSSSAATDLFFFMLFYMTIYFSSLLYVKQNLRISIYLGIAIALATLTRTNGFILILLILTPFCTPNRSSLKLCLSAFLSFTLVLVMWLIFAIYSESSLYPSANKYNIAMTYYGSKLPGIGEGLIWAKNEFDSLSQVLMYDPKIIIKHYIYDFKRTISLIIKHGTGRPLVWLIIPSLISIVLLPPRNRYLYLLAITYILQFLICSVMNYQSRFFLFFYPIIGVGMSFLVIKYSPGNSIKQWVFNCILISGVVLSLVDAALISSNKIYMDSDELSAATEAVNQLKTDQTIVISRKPHLSFFTKTVNVRGGATSPLKQLALAENEPYLDYQILIYIGSTERKRWPKDVIETLQQARPSKQFNQIYRGEEAGGWKLFRVSRKVSELQ